MKRRTLWTGLAGFAAAAVVATGATLWVIRPESATPTESKAASASRVQEANRLLQDALVQQQHRDFQGATRTYRHVLELDPANKFAWYQLGIIAQANGNTSYARAAYDKALKIDPSFMSALFSEAMMLKSSDPDRSMRLLQRAAATAPKAASLHMQLGLLLAEKNRNDEAKDAFRRAVAADPALLSQVPERFRNAVSPSPTSSHAGSSR